MSMYVVFKSFYCFWALCVCLLCSRILGTSGELVFVNAIWRHGARSSIFRFPNDPNNKRNIWPQGSGQLTQIGMQQQYALGSYFRNRYKSFLSEEYKRREIHITSTDIDRTLMSAECCMAGLYPPAGRQKWNGTVTPWQPVPIHIIPKDEDKVLSFPPHNCPKYKDLSNAIYSSEAWKTSKQKNKGFIEKIKKWTSWTDPDDNKVGYEVFDVLHCETTENASLPSWATADVIRTLGSITGVEMSYIAGGTSDQMRIAVSRTGPGELIKLILANMKNKIDDEKAPQFVGYSSHDTTLVGLLTALRVYDLLPPPFASAVLFELYRKNGTKSTEYFVKTFYRNSTVANPIPLRLLGCEENCPLQQLINLTKPLMSPDIDAECAASSAAKPLQFSTLEVTLIGILLATWLLMAGVACWFTKKSRSRVPSYQAIPGYENESGTFS